LNLQPNNGAAYYYRGLSNIQIQNNQQAVQDLHEAKALGYEGDYTILGKM
jgi:tetratricopeptide (TPR) repeat protein